MAEPIPTGVEGRPIGRRHPMGEIIAAGWLRFPDGDFANAAQVLLVRSERDCEQAGVGVVDHGGPLRLEYQVAPHAGRVWFCVDCTTDAIENGEFTSLEWTHVAWGQLIPPDWML